MCFSLFSLSFSEFGVAFFFPVALKIADGLTESSLVLVANIQHWENVLSVANNHKLSILSIPSILSFPFLFVQTAERWLKKIK